jgi:hypothetical protein
MVLMGRAPTVRGAADSEIDLERAENVCGFDTLSLARSRLLTSAAENVSAFLQALWLRIWSPFAR